MKEENYIHFEEYLSGNLSDKEIQLFKERIKTDKAFNDAFNLYKDISSHLEHTIENKQQITDFKTNLEAISDKHFNSIKTSKKKSKIFRLSQLAMVASITIFLGIFTYNHFSTPVYSDYNDFETISVTVRDAENDLKTRAENAFNSKKFEEAQLLFSQILKDNSENLEIQMYSAIALIETEHYGKANAILLEISESNSAFKNKAKWYWALSKLKQNDFEECAKILKTIPKEAEDYNRAQRLLNKLD
ncbi:hypothetical protein IMCC3317_40940 [Kordia antarctica]|uniref:Uncharacterized protein n=1 Tax=Kordia antarctica TaxID=1218801 RepID=A0A7L4ZQB7_9FLAO|nr:tetratricopeptide repeat protein [Kordia antarctica]QHI38700.1 hypothetical protein IMCC3317_40940 [Kordia antarctica]